MKKITYILSFVALMACLLYGCYYDNEETLYPESFNCNVDSVSYELDIRPLIDANCAYSGCHVSGTGRKDLSTYQGLKDVAVDGRLHERIAVTRDMPPSGPLNRCDIAEIEAWIQNGGPSQ